MKLAEALLERANIQKDCARILNRILDNALIQEGDPPAENPEDMLRELDDAKKHLQELIQHINATNAAVQFSESETIADAIARRDVLSQQLRDYRAVYAQLQISPQRHSNSEIRFVRCLDPAKIQKTIDRLSKEYRELDTALQSLNWTVDLK